MADEHREPQHSRDADAEKLAGLVPGVQAPDAQAPRPERLAQSSPLEPCTPDEVRCGEQSCAETAFAVAMAHLAQLVSRPRESSAAAVQVPQKLEPQIATREVSQP